jgi:hypothetical protein
MIIEGDSIAECWLKVLRIFVDERISEISPIILKINNTDAQPDYREALEQDINEFLVMENQSKIETTAGTIFPQSLAQGKESVFDRYEKIWRHIKSNSLNRRGTYFHRLVAYGDDARGTKNQLKHIIETYNGIEGIRSPVHRRSALIATVFDPYLDHKAQPMLGFPCLQQVCFVPDDENMHMNAIYAMQYFDTRAYGNYVGLMRLGNFMARELGLSFDYMNCMISTLAMSAMKKSKARKIVEKYS